MLLLPCLYSAKWEFDGFRHVPMGKPRGEIIHYCDKNVENLPRRPKYANPYPCGNPYKGIHKGGRPKAASFIWVPPWVQVRVFGLSGQVLQIFITGMCDFAYGFPHGYMPEPIELPLGTIYDILRIHKHPMSSQKFYDYTYILRVHINPTSSHNSCKFTEVRRIT